MNILQVHNKYRQTGGEWTVLNQEFALLREQHNITRFLADNSKELNSFASKLRLIFRTHYNIGSKKRIAKELSGANIDIMHVHNFFPLLSPSIFDAAREFGVPSVLSLHNYRLIHPNGLMYHNGKIDTRSVQGSAYRCVLDGVYRNSVLQTAVTAHMIEHHRKKRTWQRIPSAFIALSEFSKKLFVEGGIPEDRIYIKPNFLKDPMPDRGIENITKEKENVFLYVGRISFEKGVDQLIDCWVRNKIKAKLVIAGSGPLEAKLQEKSKANPSIEWLGQISREEILKRLAVAKALLFPTKCFEGQPLILLEAMSMGCPVITSKIGNPMNMVHDDETGYHYESGNIEELYEKCKKIYNDVENSRRLGINARKEYEKKYTPEKNYSILMEIYEHAKENEKIAETLGS